MSSGDPGTCFLERVDTWSQAYFELMWYYLVFPELHSFPFALSLLVGVESPAGQPGRSVTEHCISFWAGFPFSRTFWASQVQGKGEASSSCLQMGDEEKRGAFRGDGWAVGCPCRS